MRDSQICSRFSRRETLVRAIGFASIFGMRQAATAQTARMRLILLGTGGGPRPRKASSAAAQVICAAARLM